MSAQERRVWRIRVTRDVITFTLGLVTFVHQAFVVPTMNPTIFGAAVVFLVGPAAARWDDKRKSKETGPQ
jgi:hypothetical protein